jgi:cytochrome b
MGPEDLINAALAVLALIVGLMWASIGWAIARLWRRRRSRRAILRHVKRASDACR